MTFTQAAGSPNWSDLSLFVCANKFAAANGANPAIPDARATADADCTASGTVTQTAGTPTAGTGSVTLTRDQAATANLVIQIQHTTTNTVYFAQHLPVRFNNEASLNTGRPDGAAAADNHPARRRRRFPHHTGVSYLGDAARHYAGSVWQPLIRARVIPAPRWPGYDLQGNEIPDAVADADGNNS